MFNENINKKLIIFIYNIQLIIKQTNKQQQQCQHQNRFNKNRFFLFNEIINKHEMR